MPKIELITRINAPVDTVFDLSRSVELHIKSTGQTGENAVAGKTTGLMELGETVTWRAKHFGVWQTLTSKITEFDKPNFFADEMVKGAFKSFRHEHHFTDADDNTIMKDVFVFQSPLGILGSLFNLLVLTRYMGKLLEKRNSVIKQTAENQRLMI